MEQAKQNDFNEWVVGIIWINIVFFCIRGVMTSYANMIFSPSIGCSTLCLTIVGLVSLYYILQAKRWALFLWIAYRLSVGIVNGYLSLNHDFVTNIVIAILNIAIMILFLQIKKDGISAWSIIFKKQEPSDKIKDTIPFVSDETNSEDASLPKDKDDEEIIETTHSKEECHTPQEGTYNELADIVSPVPSIELEQKEKPQTFDNDISGKNENNTPDPQKRKWWLYLLIVLIVFAICGLTFWIFHRPNGSNELIISKYVYVDKYSILHLDRNCDNIAVFHGAKPVSIYSLNELTADNWNQICSSCIDEKKYELLSIYMIANENRIWLYNTLVKEGCDMGDYSEFSRYIENQEDCRWCYDKLKSNGYVVPEFEEYINQMGLDSIRRATRRVTYKKNNLRQLFDTLESDDSADVGTFIEFYDWCNADGEQGQKNRRKLYNYLVSLNYDVPDYDSFTRTYFHVKFWGK